MPRADGGTLFLDEVGDLPLPLQAKLLRVSAAFDNLSASEARAPSADPAGWEQANRRFHEALVDIVHTGAGGMPPIAS